MLKDPTRDSNTTVACSWYLSLKSEEITIIYKRVKLVLNDKPYLPALQFFTVPLLDNNDFCTHQSQ